MKKRLIALFVALVGAGLFWFAVTFMMGQPIGAVPALIGCFLIVVGVGKFIDPYMEIVFKSDYDS